MPGDRQSSSGKGCSSGYLYGDPQKDGRVATRNYIGVLSSVNCSATVVRAIEDHFRTRGPVITLMWMVLLPSHKVLVVPLALTAK